MYSVNWTTKVITIHKSDMINKGNDTYELYMPTFHDNIRQLEYAFDEGLSREQILDFVPSVNLSGIDYSPFYLIINDYTVTFEDGLYTVNLTGGNNNIADNTNKNSVSVNSANSAGMVIVTSGSGVTEQDKLDIADRVWDEKVIDHKTVGTFGEYLNKVKTWVGWNL
jgi:hypothetical protein